jgi:DMSO/TMAO reductase YedYZ molybdopterin-dependent catalytic subunit
MHSNNISRRGLLLGSSGILAATALANVPAFAQSGSSQQGEQLIPWLDQPPPSPNPAVANMTTWEKLDSWITPNERFFNVAHFERLQLKESDWRLEIGGLVKKPMTLTLADLKGRPRKDVDFTLECAGNNGFPWFMTGIGTARWGGTSLQALLKQAGVLDSGREVVFYGSDIGDSEGRSVSGEVKVIPFKQNFARSMSLADAMSPHNILCYEMNGAPLQPEHGFPVRLIAPGWYGIANVKWLKRIEVIDTRFMGRFMGRDYVTLREIKNGNQTTWTQTSVGRSLIKSAPGRVTKRDGQYRIMGAAWGAPIQRVEVKIDGGPWTTAALDRKGDEFTWKFWSLDWTDPAAGEHTITARAIGTDGRIQPAPDDPTLKGKLTYWESNGQITRRIRTG